MTLTLKVAAIIPAALVALASATLGRIGETPMQCFKRYGKVVDENFIDSKTKRITFRSKEFEVIALFIEGKAECLEFYKSSDDFTKADVTSLLDKNGFDVSLMQQKREKVLSRRGHLVGGEAVLVPEWAWLVTWTYPDRIAYMHPHLRFVVLCSDLGFARVQKRDTPVWVPNYGAEQRQKAVEMQEASASMKGF
jgi:hypothetical protein